MKKTKKTKLTTTNNSLAAEHGDHEPHNQLPVINAIVLREPLLESGTAELYNLSPSSSVRT